MGWPRVSVLWLNYNSMGIIDVVERSLEALGGLDYPDYEVIIVDNGSSDGSFEVVRGLAGRLRARVKVVRLGRNLGFAGGNNVAFRARDPDSRYIVLLNNDAIPLPGSLRDLVECAESLEGVGAVQGVILDLETGLVDTAGDFLTEFLAAYPAFRGMDPRGVRRAFYAAYADGAYSLYSVEAVVKATGYPDRLFPWEAFAYLDDALLGLQLWNAGFKVVSCPVVVGSHRRSSTFGRIRAVQAYLTARGWAALNEVANSRFKGLIKALMLRSAVARGLAPALASMLHPGRYKAPKGAGGLAAAIVRGFRDGVKLGRRLLREPWAPLDLYKAPVITLSAPKATLSLLAGLGLDYARRRTAEEATLLLARALGAVDAYA